MMLLVTEKQTRGLERMLRRVQNIPLKRCLHMEKSHSHFLPGLFTITTSDPKTYARLQRMARIVIPEAMFTFEAGRGWHSNDSTPYYYGRIDLLLK